MSALTLIETAKRWSPTTRVCWPWTKRSHLQSALRCLGHSANRGSSTCLSRVDFDHPKPRRMHQRCYSLRRDHPRGKEGRHPVSQDHHRCRNHPGIKVDTGAKEMAGHPERKSPKAWTVLASASRPTREWAPALPNGGRSSPSAPAFRAAVALRPMPRPWLVMPLPARKPTCSHRRAGGAHGRRSFHGALFCPHGRSIAHSIR